jgi:hypothetical protein
VTLTPAGRGLYSFLCDRCEVEEEVVEGDFMEAIAEIKALGWHPIQVEGEWQHVCPSCWKE